MIDRRTFCRRSLRGGDRHQPLSPEAFILSSGRTNRVLLDPQYGITVDGTPEVTSWVNKITGSSFTSTAGSRPSYVATGGPNNLPYISLRTGGTSRRITKAVAAAGITEFGIVMLIRIDAANTNVALQTWVVTNPNKVSIFPELPSAGNITTFNGVQFPSPGAALTDGVWFLVHGSARSGASGDAYIRAFGAEQTQATTTVLDLTAANFHIGDLSSAPTADVCYLHAWYGPKLSATERGILNNYYQQRFGVTL